MLIKNSDTATREVIKAVNFYVNRQCNMRCKFCFAAFEDLLYPEVSCDMALKIISEFKQNGIDKITFVGGEPLLCKWLGEAITFSKSIGLTTCVVTNGSLITAEWFESLYGKLDWLGLSVDTLNENSNFLSGRSLKGKAIKAEQYLHIASLCAEYCVKLKVNTTVSAWNKDDDISSYISAVKPDRWKIFQALPIEGQNSTKNSMFTVNSQEFYDFVKRHEHLNPIVEMNQDMMGSYLMVSPDGRIFDNSDACHQYSRPILDVGFVEAYNDITVDICKFEARGGSYHW